MKIYKAKIYKRPINIGGRRMRGGFAVGGSRRKMEDEYNVQGNYGGGWEDLTSEDSLHEAKARLREYNENERQYPHRIIKRRVRINE